MKKIEPLKNRVININKGVASPITPLTKTLTQKKIGDYPGVPRVYFEVAKTFGSTFFAGPPLCDEFMALIQHMFTEEEASIVRDLKPFRIAKTTQTVAKKEHRPVDEVHEILESMANDKRIVLSFGSNHKKRYTILPIVPGTFEMSLMRTSLDTLTDWHRKFAELFEELWETGFMIDYLKHPAPAVRYLPVIQNVSALPAAWPSDRLEVILDRYDEFAVGLCQCRMTMDITGKGCGKPMGNCTSYGPLSKHLIEKGMMRRSEKKEILEIKAEAEANGLVTWAFNEESGKGSSGSCSCCGCCCHMMRTVNELNMPGFIAPPHFMPELDSGKCDYCAKCAKACPMGAITVDMKGKSHHHKPERCIGCGLCMVACDKKHAIELKPVADYKKPPKSWASYFAGLTPNMLRNAWYARKQR